MTVDQFKLISNLQGYTPLITILVVALKYKAKPLYIKWMGWMALFSVVCHILGFLFAFVIQNRANVRVGEIYALFEPLFIIIIYTQVVQSKKYSRIFFSVYAVYAVFHLLNFLYIQTFYSTSYGKALSSIIFMVLSVDFFYRMLKELPAEELSSYPMFWFNVAVLIFFSSVLILHIFTDYLVVVLKNDMLIYQSFRNVMRFVFNILVAIAVWQDLKPRLKSNVS